MPKQNSLWQKTKSSVQSFSQLGSIFLYGAIIVAAAVSVLVVQAGEATGYSDNQLSDNRLSDSRLSDSRLSDSRLSDSRLSDSQFEEIRRVIVNGTEDQILDERSDLNSDQYGFAVAIDGDQAVVGASLDGRQGKGVGAAYIFEKGISGWVYSATLIPAAPVTSGGFGYAVDIDGDRVVIGTQFADRLYVFEKTNGTWAETVTIQPTTSFSNGQFGTAVALSGDTIVANAYQDSSTLNTAGSVYVFTQGGRGWSEEAKIEAADSNTNQFFGFDLDIIANRLMIGAPGDNDNGTFSGAVYMYTRSGTTWSQEQKLAPNDAAANDVFGAAVALDSADAVASNLNTGEVYLFETSNISASRIIALTWNQAQKLTFTPASAFEVDLRDDRLIVGDGNGNVSIYGKGLNSWTVKSQFTQNGPSYGEAVAIDGGDALVGEPSGTGLAPTSGVAKAYSENISGVYQFERDLLPINVGVDHRFGHAADIDGDYAAIGAFGGNGQEAESGLVYIFRNNGTSWVTAGEIFPPDGITDDRFGVSLSLDFPYLAVGADQKDDGGTDAGAVYIYEFVSNQWLLRETLVPTTVSNNGRFGFAVDLVDDRLIVGAMFDSNNGGTNAGSAYVYVRSGNSWSLEDTLLPADPGGSDRYGWAVGLSGSTAVVGSLFEDSLGTDAGSVYVYDRSGSSWTQTQKLTASDGGSGHLFGRSLDIEGDTMAIGAMNVGRVYIFEKDGNSWIETEMIGDIGQVYGYNLELEGDRLVVGAIGVNGVRGDSGKVFVYDRADDSWPEIGSFVQSDAETGDHLGSDVAVSGDILLATADRANPYGNDSGSAYIYTIEEPPIFAARPITIDQPEGDTGLATYTFEVARFGDTSAAANISYAVSGVGTNPADAQDFGGSFPVGSVSFGANQTTQTVSITTSGDMVVESDETFRFSISVDSRAAAPVFATANIEATIRNDDTAGLTLSASQAITLTEGGMTDTVAVQLESEPTATVLIDFLPESPIDLGAGGGVSQTLSFTPLTWNEPQTVTLEAVDNLLVNRYTTSTVTYTVRSIDGVYDGLTSGEINAAIVDNDVAAVVVNELGGLAVAEGLLTDTLTIVLTSQPTSTVTVTTTPGLELDLGNGFGQPVISSFDSNSWSDPITLTLSTIDDSVEEGAETGTLTYTVASDDPDYSGFPIPASSVSIQDNDAAGLLLDIGDGVEVTEDGITDSVALRLTSSPTATVTIEALPDGNLDLGNGSSSPVTLSFTTSNWDIPQTLSIAAVDDLISEGSHLGEISLSISSPDPSYDGLALTKITATIEDNEPAGVGIVNAEAFIAVEGGDDRTYDIVLSSVPTDTVTVTVSPDGQLDVGNGPALPITLSFDLNNWDQPQTVTYRAFDDTVAESNHSGTILHTVSSNDPAYDGFALASITVSIIDNDSPGTGSGSGDDDIKIFLPMVEN